MLGGSISSRALQGLVRKEVRRNWLLKRGMEVVPNRMYGGMQIGIILRYEETETDAIPAEVLQKLMRTPGHGPCSCHKGHGRESDR
jgi:hypothetical protein